MGFTININYILRQDVAGSLEVEKKYPFKKEELCLLTDDIPIWLAKKDWTALAEIKITSQKREDGQTTGTFVVKHIYQGEEQHRLTEIFRRMYGWK